MNIKAPILTTIALALVAAAPAAAAGVNTSLPKPGDAKYAVPAGKVEHSVTVSEVSGSRAVPSHTRHELWMSRNRARSVSTDMKTGKVTSEVVVTRDETRIFSADTGQVTISRTRGQRMPWNSSLFEAAVQRAYVEQGITRVVGETTVRGRRAFVVESVPGKWVSDEPDSRTVAVVDAETYTPYERTTTLPDGQFTQKETIQTEMLRGAAHVRFAMGTHKGAKVRHVAR
jgi:outer membrane lipoprotein-sorting protein